MTTIPIKDQYVTVLSVFGDLPEVINLALQHYTISKITSKIQELRQKEAVYQLKYGLPYLAFAQRTAQDESYVQQIETTICKTWEIDLADWEFCHQGIADWIQTLQDILLT
jgi:hypothetical protein